MYFKIHRLPLCKCNWRETPKEKGWKTYHITIKKYIREPLSTESMAMDHYIGQGKIKRGPKSKLPKAKPEKSPKLKSSKWSKTKITKEIQRK